MRDSLSELIRYNPSMRANAAGLPITLDVENRIVVLIGGDEQKRSLLEEAGAEVRAVDAFAPSVLDGAFLVMLAVRDASLAERVHAEARARNILFWAMDDPAHSDLAMPAVARVGSARFAVSTSGASPALAGRIRAQLEAKLGERFARFIDVLAALRERAKAEPDEARRRGTLQAAIEGFELELSVRYPGWFK